MALGHYNDYSVTRRWEFLSSIIVSWDHVVYVARDHAKAQLHVITRSHTQVHLVRGVLHRLRKISQVN